MSDSNNKRGERTERELVNILNRVYGKGNVSKVNSHGNTDPLGIIDIIASREGFPTRFIQVKRSKSEITVNNIKTNMSGMYHRLETISSLNFGFVLIVKVG